MVEAAAAVAGDALRVLLRTAAGMMLLAVVLSGAAFLVAFDGSWLRGALAVALVLVEVAVVGAVLSVKRAVLGGLAGGLERQHLGRSAALLLFSPQGPLGRASAAAERVPLAEAEQKLGAAAQSMVGEAAQRRGLRGSLARRIQERLAGMIQQVTLARFRADAAEHGGGVDLAQVGAEIGDRADALLSARVRGAGNRLTAVAVLATSVAALLVAFALRQWMR